MNLSSALNALSRSLVAQYDSIFAHSGDIGHSREKAVIEFLERVCPEGMGFSGGEMFDRAGATSGQVDIIVYDKVFSTVFADGSGKILAPIESTFGAIEVKSTLTTAELSDCIRKIRRYADLIRPEAPPNTLQVLPYQGINIGVGLNTSGVSRNRATYGVFAFKNCIAQDTLLRSLAECEALDYIVVPGEFIAIKNSKLDYVRMPETDAQDVFARTASSVAIWAMILQIEVRKARLVGANMGPELFSLLRDSEVSFSTPT